MRFSALTFALCLTTGIALVEEAQAQAPNMPKQVRIVLSQSPGTALDLIARLYADRMSMRLGVPFIVINRAGAGGQIAAQEVAAAASDGSTIAAANSGHAFLGYLNKNLPFDPIKDFAPITIVGEAQTVVTVTSTLGVKTLKDFVALAKAKPGVLNYNSAGIGTATHIAGAYFGLKAGVDLTNVSYRSGAEGINDMLAGRIEAVFAPLAFTLPWVKDNKLVPLAVGGPTAYSDPVAVPTAKSEGVDYEFSTWYGFLAPARTPTALIERYSEVIVEISRDQDVRSLIAAQGIVGQVKPLKAMGEHIQDEIARLRPVLETIAAAEKN